ncbi:MAG: FKBP-type peptidyl-prolyl cis-trans isomerase [Alistipes sp.]
MKKIIGWTLVGLLSLLGTGCSKHSGVKLHDSSDSLAYIIGMNVGANLQKMDSTLNVEVVCQGVRDVFGGKTRFTPEEARTYYLRVITYEQPEKIRRYEEQFLEDIVKSSRSYARSESGLTYTVEEVGDEKKTPKSDLDTVALRYVMRTSDGEQLYSSYDRKDTLRTALSELIKGLQESVRLIGKGGKMEAWVPAASAYGVEGDAKLGVKPNATLFFEIELIDVQKDSDRKVILRNDF